MAFEIDHVFICVSPGGEEASDLAAFGLAEGAPNVHPGQGTACRRFFFSNSYLELLWVSNAHEVQSELVRPTGIWERWTDRARGACPFGIGVRPGRQHNVGVPFSSWEYRPPYLPNPLCLRVATNASVLTEPMLFYLSFGQRPDGHPSVNGLLPAHSVGFRELTRLALVCPSANELSSELATVTGTGLIQVRSGPEYLLELGVDGESQGRQADFRPSLPLVFRW
jgi:Glyoxalase-like domain